MACGFSFLSCWVDGNIPLDDDAILQVLVITIGSTDLS